jgi:organic hydroperoxide reductase OsmC/OhrA
MAVKAKRREYAVTVDRAGRPSVEATAPAELGEEWTPEHLVLAGLARCAIASLTYHAREAGLDLVASATARGVVAPRDEDGRHAFVELACRIDVELDPAPSGSDAEELLARAERGCFVGASFTAPPTYRWTVNGEPVESQSP